jgi:hypothetical protein
MFLLRSLFFEETPVWPAGGGLPYYLLHTKMGEFAELTFLLSCSIWVFLLLGVEAVKTFRMNPYFQYVHTFVTTLGVLVADPA